MSTKNISIMEDVYRMLVRRKHGEESFSDVLRREFGKKKSIMDLAGAWSHISDNEISDMKRAIQRMRRRATKRLLRSKT